MINGNSESLTGYHFTSDTELVYCLTSVSVRTRFDYSESQALSFYGING